MNLRDIDLAMETALEELPEYEDEIMELYQLALDEVECGEAIIQELHHFQSAIEDLIERESK